MLDDPGLRACTEPRSRHTGRGPLLESGDSPPSRMPDADLDKKRWLPYDGGRDFTMPEMMDYPRWNFNYHLGQIAYIQTLYGDKEMH